MLAANIARAALPALLIVVILMDLGSIWALYVVALMVGMAETLYDTSAQSTIPQVVRRSQLSRANSRLYAVETTANQFVGPPLGGALVAIGVVAGFGVPSALWLVAVGVLFLVPAQFSIPRDEKLSFRSDVMEGVRFLWNQKVLRSLASMTCVFNFSTSAAMSVFVLFAVGSSSDMGLSESQFGFLMTATALGALVGSFCAEPIERLLGRSKSLAIAILGGVVFVGTPALTSNPYIVGAAFAVGGLLIVLWNVIVVSLRQRIAPIQLLGRVNSAYRMLAWGAMPLGAAAGGILSESFGLQAMFAIMAALILALLGLMPLLTDEKIRSADSD